MPHACRNNTPIQVVNQEAKQKDIGPIRESNPGPPPPEGGIIPLDQLDMSDKWIEFTIHKYVTTKCLPFP